MLWLIWLASIIATGIVVTKKNLSVGFILLSIFSGPIGLMIVLLLPAKESKVESSRGIGSFQDAWSELALIKHSLSSLQSRVINLEANLNKFLGKEQTLKGPAPEEPSASTEKEGAIVFSDSTKETPVHKEVVSHDYQEVVTQLEKKEIEDKSKEGFEFVFGKYWLNRLGVVVFVLGVAFFIGYTFKYLNAFTKILIGYLLSAGFFAWGNFLEKKKRYIRIAWGILGGAWGLLYLSTYAMHYIEATRIISSPLIELWLLAIASFAAIIYNLKYRSWIVTSVTFLLAFITAGLGGIEYSTIIYCGFLIGSLVYLSYKLNWYRFLLFGICGSYITYMYWLHPQIFSSILVSKSFSLPIYQFQLSFSIISISWLLFTVALFLLKAVDKEKLRYIISGVLLNAGFFIFLGLSEIYRIKPHLAIDWDVRFWFLVALGGIYFLFAYLYKRLFRPRLIVLNVSIAFSLLAMAVMVKFPRLSVGFFWLLEMITLFIIGVYYKEIVYRVLAGILGVLIMIRLFIVDYFSNRYYTILGIDIKHSILIFIFAALCFYFLGTSAKRREIEKYLVKDESSIFSSLIVFGTILLTFLFGKEVEAKWLSLIWALQGISILAAGFLLRDKIYRVCAICVLSLACLRLIFVDMMSMNTIYKIVTFIFLGAILLSASLVYSRFMIEKKEIDKIS